MRIKWAIFNLDMYSLAFLILFQNLLVDTIKYSFDHKISTPLVIPFSDNVFWAFSSLSIQCQMIPFGCPCKYIGTLIATACPVGGIHFHVQEEIVSLCLL